MAALRSARLVLWAAVAALGAALLSFFAWQQFAADERMEWGGPFRLEATNGGIIDRNDLKGAPYGAFFGFTHCPEVCPTTLYTLTDAYEQLGNAAKDFHVYFITVDPERDSLGYLKDYLSNFDTRIIGLVPNPEQLADVTRSFRIVYEKVPTSDGSYTMNHTASVFLFRADGSFAGTMAYGEDKDMRMGKLRKLLEP